MIASSSTGTIVQATSIRVCPRTCGPSAVAWPVSPSVADEEDDERRLDEDEDEARHEEDEDVRVVDRLRVLRRGLDRRQAAVVCASAGAAKASAASAATRAVRRTS